MLHGQVHVLSGAYLGPLQDSEDPCLGRLAARGQRAWVVIWYHVIMLYYIVYIYIDTYIYMYDTIGFEERGSWGTRWGLGFRL